MRIHIRAEALVFVYMVICFSMLIFNLFVIGKNHVRERFIEKRRRQWLTLIEQQLTRRDCSQAKDEQHRRFLNKRFRYLVELIAFQQAAAELQVRQPDTLYVYLKQYRDCFVKVAFRLARKDLVTQAYMVYVIGQFRLLNADFEDELTRLVLQILLHNSVYCRENAFQALVASGNPQSVTEAVLLLSRNEIQHSQKLISDDLLRFPGDQNALAEQLWLRMDELTPAYQCALINYFRMVGPQFAQPLLARLNDPRQDSEIHFAVLRYLRRWPDREAYPLLLKLLQDESRSWEYAALAASALDSYPGSQTISHLKQALHSRFWHVRYNSAQALLNLHVPLAQLQDILNGPDRYAREILEYKLKENAGGEGLPDDGSD